MVSVQHPGVFTKTLLNMFIMVTIYNPLLSLLALSVLPMEEIVHHSDTVLSKMALKSGTYLFGDNTTMAQFFADWMSIDAFLVSTIIDSCSNVANKRNLTFGRLWSL